MERPAYLRGASLPAKTEAKEPARVPASREVSQEEAPSEDRELFTWRTWQLPKRVWTSVLVIGSLAACMYFAYVAVPQLLFIAVISVILINRLAPYLFPVKNVLTEQTAGYRTFLARDIRPWENFVTYYEFPDGVLLTHDTRTVRGKFREGLFLYYGDDPANKEEIMKIVRGKLRPPKEALKPKEKEEHSGGIRSALRRIRKVRANS